MRRRAHGRWIVALIVGGVVATGIGAGSAPASTTAKPKWLTVRLPEVQGLAPAVVGSAAGRGWFGFVGSYEGGFLTSIASSSGGLSFKKVTLRATGAKLPIVDSQLVYHTAGLQSELRTAPLLPNGTLGAPSPVSPNPETVPPPRLHPLVVDGVRIGSRTVWAMIGGDSAGRASTWVCCSDAGALTDLTRFVRRNRSTSFVRIGLDARGRLWLAWLDPRFAIVGQVKIVELDPVTLALRTAAPTTVPGGGTATAFELVCADVCSAVFSDLGGALRAWSPGQARPVKLVSGTRENPATLLAAAHRSGALTAAYSRLRIPDPTRQVHELVVVRGDPRGLHARRVGSLDLPDGIDPRGGAWLFQAVWGTFTPGGLAFFATYEGAGYRVLTGIVRGG